MDERRLDRVDSIYLSSVGEIIIGEPRNLGRLTSLRHYAKSRTSDKRGGIESKV